MFIMKRIFSILITMIVFLSVSANDCKIQVKGGTSVSQGPTKHEVIITHSNQDDSIKIVPREYVTTLVANILSVDGKVMSSQLVPVISGFSIDIDSSLYPEGYVLEIRDDKEIVYKSHVEY